MRQKGDFAVSVIMPVYNAEKYIERAVESVINLPATGELLIVDDGSSDQSLIMSEALKNKYKKIRVLKHGDNKNYGAAQSRNLGIRNATFGYVSFLDADDYYLPNRFDKDAEIFLNDASIDGVYGFTLAEYESEKARETFKKGVIAERTTFSEIVPPEQLFKALILGGYGSFHTSGITIKKSLFNKSGLFNPKIRYVEDTELWYKLSLVGKLVAGNIIEPVAIRWVHENNSIHETDNIPPYRKLMYQQFFNWTMSRPFSFEIKNWAFMALHRYKNEYQNSVIKLFLEQLKANPGLLFSSFAYKKLYLILKSGLRK